MKESNKSSKLKHIYDLKDLPDEKWGIKSKFTKFCLGRVFLSQGMICHFLRNIYPCLINVMDGINVMGGLFPKN